MNQNEIITRLREPFTSKEIEWKIQFTTQDKARGMAVPYIDSRAIQKRLDEAVGAFSWRNEYSMWHEKSQICGISIFCEERGDWVTKFDGADCSDYEPIKGGLSDAFKRAAVLWGIGRYLYELEGAWVEIEQKGKSSVIKQDQFAKLEKEYNEAVSKLSATAPNAASKQQTVPTSPANQTPTSPQTTPPPEEPDYDFKVHSVKPSGQSSQVLELIDVHGEFIKAYIRTSDKSIIVGSRLCGVQMERKSSNFGEYNLINAYQLAA